MSDPNERHKIINQTLREHRLAIRCSVATEGFRAVVVRGEPSMPASGQYLVNGKPITGTGATEGVAITACEDALMAHLDVNPAPLDEDDQLRNEFKELKAKFDALLMATSPPAKEPPKTPPKAKDKGEPIPT